MNWKVFGTVLVICGTALSAVAVFLRVVGVRMNLEVEDLLLVAGLCLYITGVATIMGAITGAKDA